MDKKISALQYVYLFTPSSLLSVFMYLKFGIYGAVFGFIGGFLFLGFDAIVVSSIEREAKLKAARKKAERDRLANDIADEVERRLKRVEQTHADK